MSKKRILGVIGLGHVGAHAAYALAVQGIADELILVDKNAQKLASEVQDLRDAAAYLPHRVTVRAGDFPDLGACDVIINSVGKIELLYQSHDRLTEMDYTVPAVRSYAQKIKDSGFDGVLINITNPCDIVTRELALGLGLPRGRVFGTGTGLDTSRLLSALARQTGIDHKSITCYMLGEHGNQQFAPWSCVSFRGMLLDAWAEKDARFRFDRDALQKESIGGGWVTFSGKLCTEYGIATTAARMAHLVLHDEKAIMPASAELCGEYGESGLFAGGALRHRRGRRGAGRGAAADKGRGSDLPRLLRGHSRQHGASERSVIIRRYHYEHHCYEKSQPRQAPARRPARLRLRFHRPHVPHGL